MKVLFAVNNEKISESIIKRYQRDYKEIISSKNVYYFNAILKELQKDKSYDRIIISEDLEPFANNNYEVIDKFIFDKLDKISDEAFNQEGANIPIILIGTDRRTRPEPLLIKLFGIGVYDVLVGQDRSVEKVCELLNKPRSKKEAKVYYKIDSDDVDYKPENENDVSEVEIQNILAHYKKLGKNEEKYIESFDSIAVQYTDEQLKLIVTFLPKNVISVLESGSSKYRQVMGMNPKNLNSKGNRIRAKNEDSQKIEFIEKELNKQKLSKPVIIPTSVDTTKVKKIVDKKSEKASKEEMQRKQEMLKKKKMQRKQEMLNRNQMLKEQERKKKKKNIEEIQEKEEKKLSSVKKMNNTEEPKRRGRPPKNIKENLPNVEDIIEEPTKRKRGRPPKNKKEDVKIADVNIEEPVKRKRGRPPKNKNNEEELNKEEIKEKKTSTIDEEFESLSGFEDYKDEKIDDGILPGFEDYEDDDEEDNELPGLDDFDDEDDEEDEVLPGFDDYEDEDDEEDDELPGLDDFDDEDDEEDEVLPGFDDYEDEDDEEDDELPGLDDYEDDEEEDDEVLPGLDDYEDDDNEEDDELPGLDDYEDDEDDEVLPGFDDYEDDDDEEDEVLPGFDDYEDDEDEEDDELPGLDDYEDDDDNNEPISNPNFRRMEPIGNQSSREIENTNKFNSSVNFNIDNLISSDQKIVSFIGTSKNGTSFLVNNLAQMFSEKGIKTAILDLTQNRNAYYIYTDNREELRNIAYNCIENLRRGVAEGIQVNKNLTVYTSLPDEVEGLKDYENILETLLNNYSLVLLDCDFETEVQYFNAVQEIYLVQSLDVLTIQPLTAFLRELKAKDILDQNKLRIVINKHIRISNMSDKLLIGGMSSYNDPSMSFMTELFDKSNIKYTTIPFDQQAYCKYLDGLVDCKISLRGYSKNMIQSFNKLGNMVFPLISSNKPSKEKNYNKYNNYNNNFSSSTSNTLNKMKKKY